MDLPSREDLRAHPPLRFRAGRNSTKADIFLWEREGVRWILKDYAGKGAWVRATWGRMMVRRELRAYRLLQEVDGIPRLIGRIDSLAFALEFIEGHDLSHFRRGEVPSGFFRELLALVGSIHQAGVAQGDLHHRDVLIGPANRPYLVDFSTAVFRPVSEGVQARLFRAACASDRRAVLKLTHRHDPKALSEQEHYELSHPPSWYRFGKRVRGFLSALRAR